LSTKTKIFTQLDADTWDALIANVTEYGDEWSVTMSNKDLGSLLDINRRVASSRAKRIVDFGMVTPVYTELNGRPQSKKYIVSEEWLGKSPAVGDYYTFEEED
jgi:hypothetical protein